MQSTALKVAVCATFLSLLSTLPAQGDFLYTVTNSDGLIRVFDLQTQTTTSSVQVTSNGRNASQFNGMALDPTTGVLYVIVRFPGASSRQLASVDPTTGVAVVIGAMGDNFAGIAFRDDGSLFGVTGDGANFPEGLFAIDKTTAAAALVIALGNGDDGETIAFADDALLYHASGLGVPNSSEIFETIDTFGTNTITNVPLSGYDYDELTALTSYTGDALIGVDLDDDIMVITTAGHVSRIGTVDHFTVKGVVYVPSPSTQGYFRQYGTGCPATSGEIPFLYGSGTPAAGQTVSVHLLLAPPSSFGLLAYGLGAGSVPLPSVACQAQINPVLLTTGFFAGTNGDANWTISIPPWFAPIDLFIQTGHIDGTNFIVGNPLQMHTQ